MSWIQQKDVMKLTELWLKFHIEEEKLNQLFVTGCLTEYGLCL